jgi:nucleotide-binding universal stress UspA family protein
MNSSNRATIVVGVDGSTSALHAALWAADEAAQRHLRLRLVYANNEFGFGSAGGLAPPQSFFDAMQTAGFQLLADVESAIREVHPELDIGVDLQTAAAVPSLLCQTEEAMLLVLGSRGYGRLPGNPGGFDRCRAGRARRLSGRGDPRRHRGCGPTGRGIRCGRRRRLLDE